MGAFAEDTGQPEGHECPNGRARPGTMHGDLGIQGGTNAEVFQHPEQKGYY